jgi:hypothetical protein
MMQLREGMRTGDLEDLVLPMLSVDEFVSKVSKEAMVFALFVSDRDAANDLNRFIQKSPIKILDTEVSPAPDQRGFYVVFFEVMVSDRLPEIVKGVLEEIEPLVVIEKWKMQVRDEENLLAFSAEALARYVKKLREKDEKKAEAQKDEKTKTAESVLKFLEPSQLNGAKAVDKSLILEGFGYAAKFEIVAFGPATMVASFMSDSPQDLSMGGASGQRRLERMLGEGWSVALVDGINILAHQDSENMLLLRSR